MPSCIVYCTTRDAERLDVAQHAKRAGVSVVGLKDVADTQWDTVVLRNEPSDLKSRCSEAELEAFLASLRAKTIRPHPDVVRYIVLKRYALDLAHLMLPGTVVIDLRRRDDDWHLPPLPKRGRWHLKPALHSSNCGHVVTTDPDVVRAFVKRHRDNAPSGVVVAQPHVSRTRIYEQKVCVINGRMHRCKNGLCSMAAWRAAQAMFPIIVAALGAVGPLPDVWRIDMAVVDRQCYLQEVESVGAWFPKDWFPSKAIVDAIVASAGANDNLHNV